MPFVKFLVLLVMSSKALIFIVVVLLARSQASVVKTERGYPESVQETAVLQLIERILPGRRNEFSIIIDKDSYNADKLDSFEFYTVNSSILQITASSGVAGAWAFNHFLKYFCKAHISWSGSQLLIPKPLPKVTKPVKITSPNRLATKCNFK